MFGIPGRNPLKFSKPTALEDLFSDSSYFLSVTNDWLSLWLATPQEPEIELDSVEGLGAHFGRTPPGGHLAICSFRWFKVPLVNGEVQRVTRIGAPRRRGRRPPLSVREIEHYVDLNVVVVATLLDHDEAPIVTVPSESVLACWM